MQHGVISFRLGFPGRSPYRPKASASLVKSQGRFGVEPGSIMMTPDQEVQLKQIAAQLVGSMLDNNNDDWDDKDTARAFRTIYDAVKNTN